MSPLHALVLSLVDTLTVHMVQKQHPVVTRVPSYLVLHKVFKAEVLFGALYISVDRMEADWELPRAASLVIVKDKLLE